VSFKGKGVWYLNFLGSYAKVVTFRVPTTPEL